MNPQQFHSQQFYGGSGGNSCNNPGYMHVAGQYATVGPMQRPNLAATPTIHTWVPPVPQEQQYYDLLFSIADEEKRNAIGGKIAVAFFTKSNVDKLKLREIWSIADSQQKSELSRNEFYVAMRLISMAQRGESISVNRFFEIASGAYPFPTLEGVPHPPSIQTPQHGNVAGRNMGSGNMNQPSGGGYAVTEEEKVKYDGIFQQYDADNDGFLLGGEAVQLFQMSGLDRGVLRDIWSLADRSQDSRLDKLEFYVAMHLIVCVSKRGLPVPSELPVELVSSVFGQTKNAFGSLGTNTMGMSTSAAPTPTPPVPEKTGMDAFDELTVEVSGTAPPASTSAPGSGTTSITNSNPMGGSVSLQCMTDSIRNSFVETSSSTPNTPMTPSSVPTPQVLAQATNDHSGFSGSSWNSGSSAQTGRERTNSNSSLNSSVTSSASAHSQYSTIGPGSFSAMGSHPVHHPGPNSMGGGFHPHQMHVQMPGVMIPPVAAKPFMSDDEEKKLVNQLDQHNSQLVTSLTNVERKQKTIETIAEKIRDLDKLRHELMTLTLKRETVKIKFAPSSSSMDSHSAVETQTKQSVERTLQELIDSEKRVIQKLHAEISEYEKELQSIVSDAVPIETIQKNHAVSAPPSVNTMDFGGFGDFTPSPMSTPAMPVSVPTPVAIQKQNSGSSSSNFDAFGDFSFN